MADVELDWNQLLNEADQAIVGLPVGEYTAVVESATAGQASTGKPMLTVKYKVQGGTQDGRSITTRFTLSAGSGIALRIFFRHMSAMGVGREHFQPGMPFAQIANMILGRQCVIVIQPDDKPYMGEIRNVVKDVKPLGGAQPGVPMAPAGPPAPGSMTVAAAPPAPGVVTSVHPAVPAPAPAAAPAVETPAAPPTPTAPPARPF